MRFNSSSSPRRAQPRVSRTANPRAGSPVADARLDAYAAVRAHELMLNEATSKLEHAELAPLIVLNGGALVAFLTLVGALLGKDSGWRPELAFAGIAIVAWGFGLVAAAFASHYTLKQQAKISAAHRMMREGIEHAVYSEDFANLLAGPTPDETEPLRARDIVTSMRAIVTWLGAPGHRKMSQTHRASTDATQRQNSRITLGKRLHEISEHDAKRARAFWCFGISMFVVGALLALIAVLAGETIISNSASHPSRHQVVTRTIGETDQGHTRLSPEDARLGRVPTHEGMDS
jgi:hypothetical protein